MSRSEHSVILEISQAFLHDRIPEYIRDAGSYILSDSGVQKIHIQEGETWEVTGNIQGDDFQVYTPQLTFSIFDHSVKSLCNCSDAFTGICSHVAALTMHLVDELRKEEGQETDDHNPAVDWKQSFRGFFPPAWSRRQASTTLSSASSRTREDFWSPFSAPARTSPASPLCTTR